MPRSVPKGNGLSLNLVSLMDFGNPDAKGAADETIVQHTFFANATRVVEMQQSQMVLSFKNPFVASASLFDTPYSVYGSYKETENTHI